MLVPQVGHSLHLQLLCLSPIRPHRSYCPVCQPKHWCRKRAWMTLCSYLITLHYIFSYLWVENRKLIFNKFKEFDLYWYFQMSSQILSFTWYFTQNIISNNFSRHWRAAWNQSRVGQHWTRGYYGRSAVSSLSGIWDGAPETNAILNISCQMEYIFSSYKFHIF